MSDARQRNALRRAGGQHEILPYEADCVKDQMQVIQREAGGPLGHESRDHEREPYEGISTTTGHLLHYA